MAKYLSAREIKHALARLEASSARARLCEFLIGLRTLKLSGQQEVGVAEGVSFYVSALEQFTKCMPAGTQGSVPNPYFNPFGTPAYKGPRFPSNGPGNTMHGWATQANSPFRINPAARPKSISRIDVTEAQLRSFLLLAGQDEARPRLIDAATWFYRATDLEKPDGGVPDRDEIEARFIDDLALWATDVSALFRLKGDDTPLDALLPDSEGVDHADSEAVGVPQFEEIPASPNDYLPDAVPGSTQHQPLAATQSGGDSAVQAIADFAKASGFTYAPWQIATFVTALRTKPFVILAGISGTGKTKLPQVVAQATGAEIEIVPVRPDWSDSSDLLGYERLDTSFVPGHLLRFCKRAIANPTTQHFFVLDEMNVARVEYYFAEILSLMENRFVDGDSIRTKPIAPHAPSDENGWDTVYLPSNVSIVGTVNMDETTHGFSRKVLDRAFVLELSDVDLSDLVAADEQAPTPVRWAASDWAPTSLRLSSSPEVGDEVVTQVIQSLTRANEALAFAQLQVGFRVRDEISLFCLNAKSCAEMFVQSDQTIVSPLDVCLSMKILPRVQGGGSLIRGVLDQLASWCGPTAADDDGSADPASFPRTWDRVQLMQTRLEQTGFTSYWV